MSYSNLQNYSAFYNNPSNDQNGQDVYHPARSPGNSSALPADTVGYPASTPQGHRNGSAYNWSSQTPQNYGTVSAEAQSHRSSSWRGINRVHSQQPAYDLHSQQTDHSTSSINPGDGQDYYGPTSQAATMEKSQGLDNLAYASGLASAGLQDGNHGIRTREAGPITSNEHHNTGISQAHVSPLALPAPQTYSNQRTASNHSSHARNQSGSFRQDLAAAAALARAVSRRQGNQQSTALTHHRPSTSTSSVGNVRSQDGYNTQPSHGSASPYGFSASNTSPGTRQSAPHYGTPSSLRTNQQPQRYANTSSPDPGTSRSAPKPQSQNHINKQGQPPSFGRLHPTANIAHNNSNITNLVANSSPQDSLLLASHQISTQAEAMPSFIDPSQIFNPYLNEYERTKREATKAETRARRKTAEDSADESPQNVEPRSQIAVTFDSASHRPVASSTGASERFYTAAAEGKEKSTRSAPHATAFLQTGNPSQMTSDADADAHMAGEMKAMIERMREWRNKNPSMFSKLWEEMKKGGAASAAPTGSTPTRSPQIAQVEVSHNGFADTSTRASGSNLPAAPIVQIPGLPAQLIGYKAVVEDNDEGLPDLGRFPAERRYRQPYAKIGLNISTKEDNVSSSATIDSSLVQPATSRPRPVPQPHPARISKGNTIWPEEKRKALAEAAANALIAVPANRDKGITTQTISDMLDQNPNYIDLCKLLEDRGFRFHRGQFARQLLTNVPDLATTRTKAGAEQAVKPVHAEMSSFPTGSTFAQAIPVPSTKSIPPPHMSNRDPEPAKVEMSPQSSVPNFQLLNRKPNSYTQHSFSSTKPLGVPSSNIPPPTPGSKEALSRKRDFSELVDLTQLSDDEDYVMPSKQPRLGEVSPEPDMFKGDGDISNPGSLSTRQPAQGHSALARSMQSNPNQLQPVHAPMTHAAQRPRVILARPINKSEALRKSYYDPKTVARDVLIAAGRHPSERPLNAHYAGLLHRHVELDSDLSTFDWDAVDPGGPPMPRIEMVDIPAGPPKWRLGAQSGPRPAPANEPISGRDSQRTNPTAAITALARFSIQTKNLLQDSKRPADSAGRKLSRLRYSQFADDSSQEGLDTNATLPKRKENLTQPPSSSQPRSTDFTPLEDPKAIESECNMENASGKRRGRPPGAKNKYPSHAAMKKARNTSPLVSVPSRPRSPSPAHFDIYDCQWRKCSAKLHNLSTLRKHIYKVHPPPNEEAIKWGYTCWWKKCRTLVRNEDKTVTPKERFQSQSEWMDHIDKDHLHPVGMEKGDGPSTSHIGKPQLKAFDLNKYLYHPRNKIRNSLARTVSYTDPQSIAADRATYLSDQYGRSVTAPSTKATNNEYAPDALILAPVSSDAEERVPIKQYMRAHGNEKMDLKTSAGETLRAMEVKKERVGPGMDRGGCTLVDHEMRATLLQNEGLARIVMDDD